jgi:peptidyl-prolyl cis-trans isomerase C
MRSPRLIFLPLASLLALTVTSFAWSADAPTRSGPATIAAQSATAPTADSSPDPVVARVDGVEIHRSDVESAQQSMSPKDRRLPIGQVFPGLRDRLVEFQLLVAAAQKERLDQSADFRRRVKDFAEGQLEQMYMKRLLSKAPTEDQLKARYATYLKELPPVEELHLRQIFVPTEEEADKIIAKLNAGADFARLAADYGKNHAGGGSGDIGYLSRGQMTPEFSKAALALKVGQYSTTPVKTQFGWHVIKVEDRRIAPPPSFEQARPALVNLIKREKVDRELETLRKSANVELFDLNGKPAPATASPNSN